MRVGIVSDFYFPWIGGPSAVVRNLGHGLASRGHVVSLLAPSPTGPGSIESDGPLPVTRAPTVPVPFGYKLRVATWPARSVANWIEATSPDVVQVHHPFPLSAQVIFQARRRGIPIVATNHTIPDCSLWGIRRTGPLYAAARAGLGRWIVELLERCDSVATPTETAADALRSLGYGGPVVAISNGVDTERFSPGPEPTGLRARLGLDDRLTLLYTGRLDAEKEMDVWLRSVAFLSRRLNVQLVVGGEGTARPRLERLTRSLHVSERVKFIGYLPDDEYAGLYRLADAYFIMSPVELQSVTTLEAVASGLPVVAARARALPELVRDGYNGYLVSPGDWQSAGTALAHLLENASRRKEMAANSREVGLRHTLEATITQYERFLEKSIALGQGGRQRERTVAGRS